MWCVMCMHTESDFIVLKHMEKTDTEDKKQRTKIACGKL